MRESTVKPAKKKKSRDKPKFQTMSLEELRNKAGHGHVEPEEGVGATGMDYFNMSG